MPPVVALHESNWYALDEGSFIELDAFCHHTTDIACTFTPLQGTAWWPATAH